MLIAVLSESTGSSMCRCEYVCICVYVCACVCVRVCVLTSSAPT